MALTVVRIALSGKMRSGKDTVADHLEMHHGFLRLAFADKLKEVATDLFGMQSKNRALLQEFGWRMCQIDRVVWVKHVIDKIPLVANVVISDLRFPVEYNALKALDFRMVRIDVSPEVQLKRIAETDPKMGQELRFDASETALDGRDWAWDWVLNGDAEMPYLFKDVNLMLKEFRSER